MNRTVRNTAFVLSALILLPVIAQAQIKDNFEINVFGGGSFYTDKKFEVGFPQITGSVLGPAATTAPIQGAFRFTNALRGGLRVGVYTRGHWSEEFFYSYEPSKVHIIRKSAPSSSADLAIQVHNYGMSGLYYFNDDETHAVRPFLSIGIGGVFYRLTPQ